MAERHTHHHDHGPALGSAALLTMGFAALEAVGGWWTGSLAGMQQSALAEQPDVGQRDAQERARLRAH